LAFVLHVPACHEAQLRIDALCQSRQGSLVAAAPGLQQTGDLSGWCTDGQTVPPAFGTEIYQTMTGFVVRFRLYQWEENKVAP
jgi:hypothetical protein